jgi:hypothetical protein
MDFLPHGRALKAVLQNHGTALKAVLLNGRNELSQFEYVSPENQGAPKSLGSIIKAVNLYRLWQKEAIA